MSYSRLCLVLRHLFNLVTEANVASCPEVKDTPSLSSTISPRST